MGASISRISTLKRCLTILLGICMTLTLLLLLLLKQADYARGIKLRNHNTDNIHGNDSLIDFKGFQFLELNQQLCQTSINKSSTATDNILLILILSSRENLEYRNEIRKTWGSLSSIGSWDIKYAFLLGTSTSKSKTNFSSTLDRNIKAEAIENQDLIIGNFIDSYRNLSYKQVMGYKWALRYCTEAKFVVKTDDDIFIDTFQLVELVDSLTNHDKIIVGYVNYRSPPQRTQGRKWFVTVDEYPSDTYPDYCMGMGFIMSFDVVKYLYEASEAVAYFWVEDAFVTGILREYVQKELGIGLNMVALNKKYVFSDGIDHSFILWLYNEKCLGNELPWIFVHFWGEEVLVQFRELWKLVLEVNDKNGKSTFDY